MEQVASGESYVVRDMPLVVIDDLRLEDVIALRTVWCLIFCGNVIACHQSANGLLRLYWATATWY
jgi:hypothetical protein